MPKRSLPFRTHYFSLAVSKHVFLHSAHGIVFARDAIRCSEGKTYGLSPLLLYALSVPGTAIRRLKFTPLEKPQALYDTLHRLWTPEEADGLRGRPDAVILSRQVAAASLTLADRLARDGVELIVAEKGDKVSSAALRTAQQEAMWLGTIGVIRGDDNPRIDTLDRLNRTAAERHRFDLRFRFDRNPPRNEQWAALPCRPPSVTAGIEEIDWAPGAWLNSWEFDLPPTSQPRYFHNENSDRKTWLFTGTPHNSPDDALEDDIDDNESDDEDQCCTSDDDPIIIELAKDLVACWPNSPGEIARSIEATARELKWFLDGKAPLDQPARSRLLSMLGIEWQEHGYYDASGPCVLIAKNPSAAIRNYDRLAHGGDLAFAFEVFPENGQTDPSWRYLLFQSYGSLPSIIMFERGSKAADQLNDESLINYQGVRRVPNKLYQDVCATAARASRDPLGNRDTMRDFEERHSRLFDEWDSWTG